MVRYEVRQRDLSWREVDGEVVVLDLTSSTYLSLNGSGTVLWLALAEGTDEAGLADVLVEHFGVERLVAERDATAFLRSCVTQGLVQ